MHDATTSLRADHARTWSASRSTGVLSARSMVQSNSPEVGLQCSSEALSREFWFWFACASLHWAIFHAESNVILLRVLYNGSGFGTRAALGLDLPRVSVLEEELLLPCACPSVLPVLRDEKFVGLRLPHSGYTAVYHERRAKSSTEMSNPRSTTEAVGGSRSG